MLPPPLPARRGLVVRTTLLALTLVLAGCGGRTAGREVVVYTSVDQVYSEPILKEYEKKSGVRVRTVYDVEAAKTTGLVTRLQAEKGRPQADVFWNGEFAQTLGLKEKGILAPYHSPVAADIPATFKDPEGFWTGVGGRARVFIVNTTLLKPSEYPSSLEDLLSSRWPADKIGVAHPLFGTMATHAAALYATIGPELAGAFFTALRERGVRVVDGNSVVRDMVVSGQLAFGLTDTDDAAGAIRRGAPVCIVAPDQKTSGTLVIPGAVAMIAGAPHAAEARAMVDYLVSAETEMALVQSGFYQIPVRPGAKASDPAFANIRPLPVSLKEVHDQMPRSASELREIFVR
ncbi:MAG: extracellular solute-binding protein [bacterium]|nr:extracellular solute-binding protein [Candidatus Sumerlaeota bacterium]